MARNRGGQHQRRPGLSLMGLAASTILIRSLSLKPTDWPQYLQEPRSCSTARPTPANIWPRGPVIQYRWPWPNSSPCTGLPQQSRSTVYIFIQPQPHGLLLFFASLCLSFFIFSVWIATFSVSLLSSLLFIWPSWPPTLLLIHTHTSYPGNEDGV